MITRLRYGDERCVDLRVPAFSLVEVVMALGIVAFGIVAIFALLPAGLASVQDGKLEEAGSDILALAAADLRAAPRTGGVSPLFGLDVRGATPGVTTNYLDLAGAEVETPEQAGFRLVASPRPSANSDLAVWHLAVEWPPQASDAVNRVETVTLLRR